MKVDAVVLAGGDASKVVASAAGPKSLIDIAGRPMIGYVTDALRQCSELDNIVIALPAGTDPAPFAGLGTKIVTDTHGVVDAIYQAIKVLDRDGYVMVVSSDTPMISAAALNDFLGDCKTSDAEIYYTVIPKEVIEKKFPGTRRTYIRLRDGIFTGGNVHLAAKDAFIRTKAMGERIFANRKSPLGLIRLIGFGFVMRFLFGRLTIASLEAGAGRALGAKVKAVVTRHPELGVDVDKPEDLKIAEAYLRRENQL